MLFLFWVVLLSGVTILIPLLLILGFCFIATIHRIPRSDRKISSKTSTAGAKKAKFPSVESVVVPYDPCLAITPDLVASCSNTTATMRSNNYRINFSQGRRASLTSAWYKAVLGLENPVKKVQLYEKD